MSKKMTRPWKDFMDALSEHLGSPKRAQSNFCENSEYSLSTLQHWRKTDKVPDHAFDAIKAIDPDKCSTSKFQGYHSSKFTGRVVELSAQNKTLSEIATILAEEYDRPVTENMIKGIRYRNKDSIKSYQSREKGEGDD